MPFSLGHIVLVHSCFSLRFSIKDFMYDEVQERSCQKYTYTYIYVLSKAIIWRISIAHSTEKYNCAPIGVS